MRALAIGVMMLAGLPAAAQWKLPQDLAPLPRDGQSCNEARTHCVVNARDWFMHKAATDVLASRVVQLQIELEEERASKTKRCAVVTPSARTAGVLLRDRQP
jgi:hypothetical protein